MQLRLALVAAAVGKRCVDGLEASGGRPETSRREMASWVATTIASVPGAAFGVAEFLEDVPLATDDFVSRPVTPAAPDEAADDSPRRRVIERAKKRALSGGGEKKPSATEALRFGVRVARSDGTFAVRDDDGEAPLVGALDLSVYGSLAPANAALFLELALGESPGYASSLFDEIAGNLLIGGRVRGLDEQEIFGERVVLYRQREVLGTRVDREIEKIAAAESTRLSHDRAGLLTRRRAPESTALLDFGITPAPAPELDRDWTVIGAVAADPAGLLAAVANLPTYSAEAVGDFSKNNPIAADVFRAERGLFRAAADAVGDTRRNNVFPGKILRRVEVTRVDLLKPL